MLDDLRRLYIQKEDYLSRFLKRTTAVDFYRDVFPLGSFERVGHPEDHKGNGVITDLSDRQINCKNSYGKVVHRLVFDDLSLLDAMQGRRFAIMAPVSFYGRRCKLDCINLVYALAIDLDGVDLPQLRDLLYQMDQDIIPAANYVINSGTGLHLYYLFENPIVAYNAGVRKMLWDLKSALIDCIWNKYTSNLKGKPQKQGITQGYRVIGSLTKLGDNYPVTCYQLSQIKFDIQTLVNFVPKTRKEYKELESEVQKEWVSLDRARELWPNWYERKIEQQQPSEQNNKWQIDRRLYDWWLRRIREEAMVGHRYHCIVCLAIYAVKCDIEEEELRRDAYSLLGPYDALSQEAINRFTEDDVEAALTYFNENYNVVTRKKISEWSGLEIQPNKRNYQTQAEHLEEARMIRDIRCRRKGMKNWYDNGGRPKGSGSAKVQVQQWQHDHLGKTKADCHRDTKLDPKTVRKWWIDDNDS